MKPNSHRLLSGFTLVEMMLVVGIVGLVMAGVLPFFVSNLKMLYISEQKLLINGDVRAFTNNMINDADTANNFVLYQSFYPYTNSYYDPASGTNKTSTVSRDCNGDGVIDATDRMVAAQDSNFLVLIYYQDPFYDSRFYDSIPNNEPTLGTGTNTITRLVGYWLAPNVNYPGETALYRFDTDKYKGVGSTWTVPWGATFPAPLNGTVTLESLLPPATQAGATNSSYAKIVLNNLEGLWTTFSNHPLNGLTFLNFQGQSVIVHARILHGNQAKRVTNTYNFTVKPRG